MTISSLEGRISEELYDKLVYLQRTLRDIEGYADAKSINLRLLKLLSEQGCKVYKVSTPEDHLLKQMGYA